MVSKRKNCETDHRRKILVIIDNTQECRRAVSFAAQHAKNTNRTLMLLSVIDSSEFQHFLGVNEIMRTEATQNASMILQQIADEMRTTKTLEVEGIVREGKKIDEILKLIDEDRDIAIIVLAASGSTEGPGPLVQSIANRGGTFSIPVTIIPSGLADEDIETVA
ncbi:universal stress protein [Bartonella sp. A05]|uniref:universal stress protein n=1 Tax=Bartonella sp. A05 TaxID=2967261 RepID=UPI0022A93CA0|nr:universal stress protein [Bartonella sp. A05]MCZ2203288.1 universal stress protein [Bartonella sp. A05]